jgi:hypothetical protein
MSNRLSDYQKDEYQQFRAKIIAIWTIDESSLFKWDPILKGIYRNFLSFACAATIAGHKTKRNEYVFSAIEANKLSIVLSLKGLQNPACVLIRQSIELVLKHIYFLDHPIEYSWAVSRLDYKELTFQFLLEYLKKTQEYRIIMKPKEFDISEKISNCYHIFSRYVHVHSKDFMGYKSLNAESGREILKSLDVGTKELWPVLSLLLTVFSTKSFLKASLIEQRLIKDCLPPLLKKRLNNYLYSLQ